MKRLKAGAGLREFFAELKRADNRALFLDYDGTLAPFNIKREDAVPYPGVRRRLNRLLAAEHTRIVIISGRPADSLLPLLNLTRNPEVWGTHGLERLRPDGAYSVTQINANALNGLEDARQRLERTIPREYCEVKRSGIAIHTRALDEAPAAEIRKKAQKELLPLADNSGLELLEFDGGIELRVKGIDKGRAVATVLGELDGNRAAAYLGDDLTDEDAFAAIKGRGVGILIRRVFRPTNADFWLRPPEELMEFFDVWLQVSGGAEWLDKLKEDWL
jgi:trehalose 6-phosphate phosphatase